MARIGYIAQGTVFLIIGTFALLAAIGVDARPQGTTDALYALFEQPLSSILIWLVATGLACFAGWRLSGAFYLALAALAANVTVAAPRTSEDQSARKWADWLMAKPLG